MDRAGGQTTSAKRRVSAFRYAGQLQKATPQQQRRALLLVLLCTVLGAAAQILIKMGARALGEHPGLVETAVGIFTTPSLFVGYALYGVNTVLLVLALRHGELSILYPVITLTYVWVTGLSVFMFHDTVNVVKSLGIAVIIAGVAILGRAETS